MPQSVLNWKTRRAISENPKVTSEALFAAGRELMAANMLVEAADFMARANDGEGLGLIKAKAIQDGNFFIYQTVARLLKEEPSRNDLAKLADKAASLGLSSYEDSARKLLK
jgi:hypothetical protein